ncbi:MAG TPA: matrixin family metalloprotease [Anaerolineae bacterium]
MLHKISSVFVTLLWSCRHPGRIARTRNPHSASLWPGQVLSIAILLLAGNLILTVGLISLSSKAEADPRHGATAPAMPPPAYDGALILKRSVAELTTSANRILVADVLETKSHFTPDGRSINTEVTLAVDKVFKGQVASQITLTLPGGQVGDERLLVGGVPNFLSGERVLLFLEASPDSGIAGLWQGKYSLSGDRAFQPETGQSISVSGLEQSISRALAAPVEIGTSPELVQAEFTTSCPGWSELEMPVAHFVNPANPGAGAPTGSGFVRLVYDSLNAWQALSNSWITLRVAGTTARDANDHFDGNHDVVWTDLSGSTLGVNYCATSFFNERIDSDTLFDNSNRIWTITAQPGLIDLRSVAEHEFGHGIGIGHSDQTCDGFASTPLMCASITTGVRKTILTDDSNAAAFLYPQSGSPPAAPSNLDLTSSASSNTLTWSDNSFNEHAFEIQRADEACTETFVGVATVPANTTSYLDSDYGVGLNGVYCYRVKALNRGGDSSFSNAMLTDPLEIDHSLVSTNVITAGARITYTITVHNNSNQTVTDTVVSDDIPADTTYVSNSAEASPNIGDLSNFPNNTQPFDIGAHGTVVITFALDVDNSVERGDLLINTSRVSAPALSQDIVSVSINVVDPLLSYLPLILKNN